MKKRFLFFTMVLFNSFIFAQNPWVKCNGSQLLLKIIEYQSNEIHYNPSQSEFQYHDSALGTERRGYISDIFKDTCVVLDLSGKCPHLGTNELVLMCFDSSGKAQYSVVKGYDEHNPNDEMDKFQLFDDILTSPLISPTNNPRNRLITSQDSIYYYHLNGNGISEQKRKYRFTCDTCVERIIGIGIGMKNGNNDKDGNPLEPCFVSCDSLHVGPTSPPPPGATMPEGTIDAHAKGNGILTYNWSFAGSPLSGNGTSCPDIDVTNMPGGGIVCVTVTNWLPDGRNCSCVMCFNLCYNIKNPKPKMASSLTSPIIGLYPNPASDRINLNLSSKTDDVVYISLRGIDGKEFQKTFYSLTKGINKFELDIKSLAIGQYFINIQSKEFKEAKSFRKE